MKKEVKRLKDNIYFLKGSRSSNIYYLDYQKKAIIDTGHPDEKETNFRIFKDSGFSLDKIDYIINTHSHGDHVGANDYLKKLNPSIDIIASAKKILYQKERKKIELLKGAEVDFEEYGVDLEVKDNDKIDLGNSSLTVIETPGHTIDSISLYNKEEKIIFSGDIIYYRVITQLDYYQDLAKSLKELVATYDRLLEIDAECYYAGHGDPITNPKENINLCIKKLKRFERQPEMIIVNNLIPSIEFYIHRNESRTIGQVKEYLLSNMSKFKNHPFFVEIEENKFIDTVDKTIALMKLMKMIKEEDGVLSSINQLNEHIG